MTHTVTLPLWLFALILLFAAVTALSHFLLPSVRWFFRRRFEKAVDRLNVRLKRPIQPFKLARRHDMIQRLIYDPEVSREIALYAEKNKVPDNVAFQKAREYAREIVPSFSAFAYFSFAMRLAKVVAESVYRIRTAAQNDGVFAAIPENSTPVFVMNHRSNMDYVLVTYLASKTSTLSYAVGEWARVWPLSALIRMWGAYFIRRRSRGSLYRKVLSRYVQMATNGGDTQAFYPEGGLSLTGKLQPPKVGLLSYLVDGFDPEGARDIVFVPVAINYDRVLEDRVLMAAHERGDRRFGARISVVVAFIVRKFWRRLRGHDTRFGTAAVAFGEPISLRSYGKVENVDALSQLLMARIEAVMPVLGVPLVATVLRGQGPLTAPALEQAVQVLASTLPAKSVVIDMSEIAMEVTAACMHMAQHGLIELRNGVWHIMAGQEIATQFYANSIAHYLPEGPHGIDAATANDLSAPAGS
ncbi:1-acyl-sn-glycerol-3-phosphate acyltransferase [Sulfitobacter guttiformis]|uniref:Glycerol-3-phosphate acyltransferase n=1 Tax=Sulfitobacter guttiformis TaxID=74349 RepID=A0A420DUG9_9RHOB|nr:1-acyl-sn-glycerol-3-phosphate acyltransferase [Sulfitobacter guttiformis]KIN71387.1 Acyltransferase [Sulfitobacter guttiformis KCTC 32187]RKE97833.1 glycerol-3-phosphate acyltransferase [Sulfitobacter guttiformis]